MHHWFVRSVFLGCVASLCTVTAGEGGLSFGPPLILVRDVQPGRVFSLRAATGVYYHLTNNSQRAGQALIQTAVPDAYGFQCFERGYEPAPDVTWFTLDRSDVALEPGGNVEADLSIHIPDRPEHYNRHWIVYVNASPKSAKGTGAVLQLQARIMLETTPRSSGNGAQTPGGAITLAPAEVAMTHTADGTWTGTVQLTNNGERDGVFDLIAVWDLYVGADATKGHRFFQNLERAILDERWAEARPMPAKIATGGGELLTLTAPVSKSVTAGQRRDEVFFVARRLPADADTKKALQVQGAWYDRMELLRLRYEVPGPDTTTVPPSQAAPTQQNRKKAEEMPK